MPTQRDGSNRQMISEALLDELLSGDEKPEDLLGDEGLSKKLERRPIEKTLGAEVTDPLGYEKNDPAGRDAGNSRNGPSTSRLLKKSPARL